MGCEKSTVKCLLFLFNIVFLLSGVTLITIGALIKSDISKYNEVVSPAVNAFAILFIVIGSVVAVVAFFGCCGAVIESRCMILTFAFFLGVIFVVEVVLGILIFVYRPDVEEKVHKYMSDTWMKYDLQNAPALSAVIDSYQHTFQCCGVDSNLDWVAINTKRGNIASALTTTVPDSCCKEGKSGCGAAGGVTSQAAGFIDSIAGSNINNVNTKGCFSQIQELIHTHGNIVAGVVLGVSVVEMIGMMFACYLASAVKKDKRLRNFV